MNAIPLAELWDTAQRSERSGDLATAIAGYGAIITRKLEASEGVPAYVCERLGLVASAAGAAHEGLAIVGAARKRMAERGDDWGVFRFGLRMSEICLGAGDPQSAGRFLGTCALPGHGSLEPRPGQEEDALEALERAAWPRRSQSEQVLARAEALLVLARYYNSLGRYGAARSALRRARAAEHTSELLAREQLALFAAELELQCGALPAVEHALQAAAAGGAAEHPGTLLVRARCLSLRGRLSEAKRELARAAQLQRAPGAAAHHRLGLQIALDRIRLLTQLNRIEDAGDVAREFAATLGAGALSARLRAQVEDALAFTRRKLEHSALQTALPFVPAQLDPPAEPPEVPPAALPVPGIRARAPSQRRQHEPFGDEWAALFNRFLYQLDIGAGEAAERALQSLELLSQHTDSARLRARARYARALSDYHRGQLVAAERALQGCLAAAREQGLRLDELEALQLLAWTHLRLGKSARYLECAQQALDLWNQLLLGIEDEDLPFVRLNKWSMEDELISARMRSLQELPRSRLPLLGPWWTRQRAGRELLRRFREVDAFVGWKLDRDFDPQQQAPLPARAFSGSSNLEAMVRQQLAVRRRGRAGLLQRRAPLWRIPRDTALLYYYALPDRVLSFTLARRSIELRTLYINRVQLDQQIRELTQGLLAQADSDGVSDASLQPQLAALAAALELPELLGRLPSSIQSLILVPHDVLVNVPFAALPTGPSEALVSRYVLSSTPNLQLASLERPSTAGASDDERYLGLAGALYPGQPALPHAEYELMCCASVWSELGVPGEVHGLADQPPLSQQQVLELLPRSSLIHFSCHGEFAVRHPHHSRLLLGDERGDASVSLAAIEQLELERARVVLLSACWAANTALLPGGEPICLPAAFLRAGAEAVIAPSWKVDDAAGAEFARDFWQALGHQGSARALTEVQRRWRSDGSRKLLHWAGYAHYGPA